MTPFEAALAAALEPPSNDELLAEVNYVFEEPTRPVHVDPEMLRALDALARRAA